MTGKRNNYPNLQDNEADADSTSYRPVCLNSAVFTITECYPPAFAAIPTHELSYILQPRRIFEQEVVNLKLATIFKRRHQTIRWWK